MLRLPPAPPAVIIAKEAVTDCEKKNARVPKADIKAYIWYRKNLLRILFGRELLNLPSPLKTAARQNWVQYEGAGPPFSAGVFEAVWSTLLPPHPF